MSECPTALSGCLHELGGGLVVRVRGDVLVKIDLRTGKELAWRTLPQNAVLAADHETERICVAAPSTLGCLDQRLGWLWQKPAVAKVSTISAGAGLFIVSYRLEHSARTRWQLLVMDVTDGTTKWKDVSSDPVRPDASAEVVYRDGEGRLVAREGASGKVLWRSLLLGGFGRIGVDAEHVVVGAGDGQVYCLSRRTGDTVWKHRVHEPFERESGVEIHVAVGGDQTVASTVDPMGETRFHAFRARDGLRLWSSDAVDYPGLPELVEDNWRVSSNPGILSRACSSQLPPLGLIDDSGRIKQSVPGDAPQYREMTSKHGARVRMYLLREMARVESRDRGGRVSWVWERAEPWPPNCVGGH
jgi:outer membrane protein assembly factor BamB